MSQAGVPTSRPKSLFFQWRGWLKALFATLVLTFLVERGWRVWESRPAEPVELNWGWLALAGLAYLCGWFPSVWFWQRVLSLSGVRLGGRDALRAYFVGGIGKYVPGKALVLVIRAGLIRSAGCRVEVGIFSAMCETLAFMGTGAIWALALLPICLGNRVLQQLPPVFARLQQPWWIIPVMTAVFVFITLPGFAWLTSRLASKLTSEGVAGESLRTRDLAWGIVTLSGGWWLHAASLGCVLQSLGLPIGSWLGLMARTTLSTVGGFVILLAPGGLGIREWLLVESLTDDGSIRPDQAMLAALLLRGVWFLMDVLAAALLYVLPGSFGLAASPSSRDKAV